jgi:small subunit ribosomal protein S16
LAVKLRLRRMGKKRQPIYKVVAADARSPRDGKIIEAIGMYNPKTDPATIELKEDRVLYWLGCGAQPTETVRNILSKNGILLKKELIKEGLSEEAVSAKLDEWSKNNESSLEQKKVKAEQKKKEKAEAAQKILEEENKVKEAAQKKLEEENKEKEAEAAEVKDTASEDVSAEEEKSGTE